jgi:hypothetical protein
MKGCKKEMKLKTIIFLLAFYSIICSLVIASQSGIDKPSYNLDFVKNSSEALGNAQLLMWYGNNLQLIGYNFEPNQKYALVYSTAKKLPNVPVRLSNTGVGSSYTNKYLGPNPPTITCLKEITSDLEGNLGSSFIYNYMPLTTDKKNETFWIVKSSNIICKSNKIVSWISGNYLNTDQIL